MPAYKDEKSGKWFASFYYKDWDGQCRKKLKKGFETKKEAVTYERNFTVKMSGSLNMLFEDYFELYKADVIGTIRLNTCKLTIQLKEFRENPKTPKKKGVMKNGKDC